MVDTRDRIIVATNELFRVHGYNATSLSQISQASGATVGSIYHFFPGGKEALAAAGGREGLDEAAAAVERLQAAITRLDERTQGVDAAEAGLAAATEAAVASRTAADEDVRQEQIAVERRDSAASKVDQARSGRADARQTHRAHALRARLN